MTSPIRKSSPTLLIAAHCKTLRRKTKRFDYQELSAILNDLVRELTVANLARTTYIQWLHEIIQTLNENPPTLLISISSHYFFVLVRNLMRDFLEQLAKEHQLNIEDVYILRNSSILFEYLVKKITDVSKLLHWITDVSFLDAFIHCLNEIQAISKADVEKRYLKQLSRLLNMFADIQDRLPFDGHQRYFLRLLEPVIKCLTSPTYHQLFKNLKAKSMSLTAKEKFYLIKCPYFLSSYNGPLSESTMENVLRVMLPRYVSLLDQHLRTVGHWQRSMKRSMHHLLTMMVFAEGFFTHFLSGRALRSLIDDLLKMLKEETLIERISTTSKTLESILINATLIILNVLVYEPDALEHLKERRTSDLFRRLITTNDENIVLNAYMMLAYTIEETDLQQTSNDLNRLYRTTIELLQKCLPTEEKTILQLLETFRGLIQYEQIREEILQRDHLPYLIQLFGTSRGLGKQILLECLWTLSFDPSLSKLMRENVAFIETLEQMPKPGSQPTSSQSNILRRSTSFSTRRTNSTMIIDQTDTYHIADGLLWQLIKRKQETNQEEEQQRVDRKKKTHDVMISYSYNDRDFAQKIYDVIHKIGYRVWFDRDSNSIQKMEDFAEIMHQSSLILLCLSDSYKRDNLCRTQAEYVLQTGHSFLPLIVRKGSKVDSWFSSIFEKIPPVDLTDSDFSSLLLKELSSCFTEMTSDTSRSSSSSTIVHHTPPPHPVRLPIEYIERNTHESRYRSMPVHIWSKTDVLDFLFDSNLQTMMPVCETMTGQGLAQLFRMCQAKPSRLYSQLNDELRVRFNGLTLPMGIYTQFLIEMDALVGPAPNTVPSFLPSRPLPPPRPKVVERLVYVTPNQSNVIKPIEPIGSSDSKSSRVIERAIFRPASTVGRPYNFVVESVQEPTVILQQVERYGPQLLLLDQKAQEHRERHRSR